MGTLYYHFNLKIILLLIVVELVMHQLYFALTFIFQKFCSLLDGHNPALNLRNMLFNLIDNDVFYYFFH